MNQVSILVDNGCSRQRHAIGADAAEIGWLPDGIGSTVRRKPCAEQPLRRKRLGPNQLTDGYGGEVSAGRDVNSAVSASPLLPETAGEPRANIPS